LPKFLITEIDGETTIHDPASLELAGLSEADADECFNGVGYWLTITLRKCTFADQQTATREAGGDETLLPQKRFVLAVEKISKRECGAESESLPAVTEAWFTSLDPPALGNAINLTILQAWYPVATKADDFFKRFRQKQDVSEKASG